jgi:hypothetical protein
MSDPNWLKEPDPSGDAVVYVSIPENAKLTPEVTEALKRLGKALQDEDAADKAEANPCKGLRVCNPFRNCQPLHTIPCFVLASCRIKV